MQSSELEIIRYEAKTINLYLPNTVFQNDEKDDFGKKLKKYTHDTIAPVLFSFLFLSLCLSVLFSLFSLFSLSLLWCKFARFTPRQLFQILNFASRKVFRTHT